MIKKMPVVTVPLTPASNQIATPTKVNLKNSIAQPTFPIIAFLILLFIFILIVVKKLKLL